MKHGGAHPGWRAQPLALEMAKLFGGATWLVATPLALGAPQGGTVAAGQASIRQDGALTTITQGSQRAAIDWRSFNVGANETVRFVQPDAGAAILNRVTGPDPSAIFGRITANGQVLLLNPNGILFGRSAQVDVGALTATTAKLSNADFMAGRLHFTEPGQPGATVENQGRITVAEGGFAALVGRQVANSGTITARLGKVTLAAGEAFVLDLYGDRLVNLIVDPAAMSALTDANGQPLAARVDHSGQIVAEGGRVQLSVGTVKHLVDNLINLSGVVRATSFSQAEGVISLQGDAHTRVDVAGTLDTSGESGGRIEVTGREVNLQSGASLAAVGGQGSIAVGGGWQGRGPLAHAEQVNVAQGASLDASGGTQGDGGTVVLWSDKATRFEGRIDANGGTERGNAGQAEVSSKGTLGFRGDVNLLAPHGQQGSLLLDPLNLTIAATNAGDSQVSADQIRYFLTRGTNVTMSADQNVTVDAEVNGLVTGGGGTAGGGLTLTAGQNLTVNQSLVLNDGALNLTATSGTLTQADGTVLYSGSGAVNLRGGAGVDVGRVLSGGAVDIRSAGGAVNVRNAIVSATSNGAAAPVASLNVQGAGGITLNGALVQGNATLRSTGGGVTVSQAIGGAAGSGLTIEAAGAVALAGASIGSGGIGIITSSGNVTSQGSGASQGGLISTAGITVRATAGQIGTSSAQLDLQATSGDVVLEGHTGVNAGTVLGQGAISLSAAAGGVTVARAIAGDAGVVSGSSAVRPTSVNITARDAIDLAGAAVGSGGLSADSTSGTLTLRNASIFSSGAVTLSSGGSLSLLDGAGISTTTGSVSLTSRSGALTIGNAGVRADGEAADITVASRGDLAVNGDLQARSGTIDLRSSQGAVRALASATGTDGASNATLDAGADATRSIVNVRGAGDVELGELIAANRVQVTSDAGNVVLKRGLGGNAEGSFGGSTVLFSTGYVDYARGYLSQYRPNVGRLVISAPQGSVELNGLNLDGNTNATDTAPGLSVTAGRRIVSNGKIAVNKGDIMLAAGSTQATDGVYLGNSVYSRGYDSVGADGVRGGSDDMKIGYGVRISGGVLGLFDNTVEMAQLPVNTFDTVFYANGVANTVRTDINGFLVDPAGFRIVNPDGSYQMVGIAGTYPFLAANARLYNVLLQPTYGAGGELLYTSGVIAPNNPGAGSNVVGPLGTLVASTQEIAKIEIANNVANYQDSAHVATLVPAAVGTAGSRTVQIGTPTVAGVANHAAQTPLRLSDPLATFAALSRTPIVSVPTASGVTAATQGISLKVLAFREAGDTPTLVWSSSIHLGSLTGSSYFLEMPGVGTVGSVTTSLPIDGVFTASVPALATRSYTDIHGQLATETVQVPVSAGRAVLTFESVPGVTDRVMLRSVDVSQVSTTGLAPLDPAFGTNASAWSLSGWKAPGDVAQLRLGSPSLTVRGTASGVDLSAVSLPQVGGASLPVQSGAQIAPGFQFQTPHPAIVGGSTSPRSYQVTQAVVDSKSVGDYLTKPGTRVFLYDGFISSATGTYIADSNSGVVIPGLNGISGFNNSTVGFASIGGGFGSQASGSANAVGAGSGAWQGIPGVTVPDASGVLPLIDDRLPQEASGPGVAAAPSGMLDPGGPVFGTRPAAQADFGRGGAVPGSAVNVFKRDYRVATSSSSAVCSPDVVQTRPGDGGTVRECSAGK